MATTTRPDLTIAGVTGLTRYGGYVQEELLTELQGDRWRHAVRQMADMDATVGAVLFAIEMMVRQVDWRIDPGSADPADQEIADFVSGALFEDMSSSWADTLSEILTFLPWGWAYLETVYKLRQGETRDPAGASAFNDGKVGWRKWSIRAQESLLRWDFDDDGGIQGMRQIAAPDYIEHFIPIDKALLFRTTTRKGNPEGRSVLRSAYRCFSEDTEILTRRGWVQGLELSAEDEVATLVNGESLIYERPSAINVYDHDGEMIHLSARGLDQLVTPNHRLWVRREHKDTFEFIEAGKVALNASYKTDARWDAPEVDDHTIPAYEDHQRLVNGLDNHRGTRPAVVVSMDAWATFMGWFLSEGDCSHAGARQAIVGITQNEGPKANQIRAMLAELPWHVYEHRIGDRIHFEICDRQLWTHLYTGERAPGKSVPDYLGDLSSRQIRRFLDAYAAGDGSVVGGGVFGDYGPYAGTPVIFTASRKMADGLAVLGLKAGHRTGVREQFMDGFGAEPHRMYVVTLGKPTERLRVTNIERVEYQGKVWCPTTTSGVVFVRRNGKSCWSGNSWYFKRRIENIEGIGIERDLAGLPVAKVPPSVLLGATADDVAVRTAMLSLVTNIRRDDQEGVLFPLIYDEKGNELYKLELLSTGGRRNFDTNQIINRYDQRIAASVLADFVLLGSSSVGSYALSSDKTNLFGVALGAWLGAICDVVNRHAIPRLLAYNGWRPVSPPKLAHADIESLALGELGQYVKMLADAGIAGLDSPEASEYLLGQAKIPFVEPEPGETAPSGVDSSEAMPTGAPPKAEAAKAQPAASVA